MKLIIIEEGSAEILPWVQVEIEPGRWPFEWWYEVSYYDPENMLGEEKFPCWVHYYQKDGGAFGFWRVMTKARDVTAEVWDELFDKMENI